MDEAKPIVIDHIIIVCKGCRQERTVYPDAPLRGAEALANWMQTRLTPCTCGAATCDIKAHLQT